MDAGFLPARKGGGAIAFRRASYLTSPRSGEEVGICPLGSLFTGSE
jgi:hypothetical protein